MICKQYEYRSATPCCNPLVITLPGSFRSSDVQNYRHFHAMLSPPLVTSWTRQKVPIVAACGVTPLVITHPAARRVRWWHRIFYIVLLSPPTVSPPTGKHPPATKTKQNSNKSCPLSELLLFLFDFFFVFFVILGRRVCCALVPYTLALFFAYFD